MIQIEYLPIVLTGIGLIASILYYSMVLRNSNRTRQAQLFMSIYNNLLSAEGTESNFTKLPPMTTIEDWYEMQKNDEQVKAWNFWTVTLEGLGVLLRKDLVDIEMVARMLSGTIIYLWERYRDMLYRFREEYNWPRAQIEMEYLYNRIVEYAKKHPELNIHVPEQDIWQARDNR